MKKINSLGQNVINDNITIRRKNLAKGEEIPVHSHEGYNVFLCLVDGELNAKVDGKEFLIEKGDIVNFSEEEKFGAVANKDTSFFVFLIS